MTKTPANKPIKPIQLSLITFAVWLFVIGLFLWQYYGAFSPVVENTIVSVMILVGLFIGLPALLLLVVAWCCYWVGRLPVSDRMQSFYVKLSYYLVMSAFAYGVGVLIDGLITKEINHLPLKLVLLLHLLAGIYVLIGTLINVLGSVVIGWLGARFRVPVWVNYALYLVIMVAVIKAVAVLIQSGVWQQILLGW